jgi:hypothetical protein
MLQDIKGFKDWIQIKTSWNGIMNVRFHIVSIPNGNTPLGNE